MAGVISASTSELTKEANRLKKLLATYRKSVNGVYKECLMEIGNAWKSSDNQVFIDKLTGYKADLDGAEKWLQSYIEILEYASKTYDEAQAEAARIAASGRG